MKLHELFTAKSRLLTTEEIYTNLNSVTSPHTLGYIFPESCDAIYEVLKRNYLKRRFFSNANSGIILSLLLSAIVKVSEENFGTQNNNQKQHINKI